MNAGVDKEASESAARMVSRERPVWRTDCRLLCWLLGPGVLFQMCFNEDGYFEIFKFIMIPLRTNCFGGSGNR